MSDTPRPSTSPSDEAVAPESTVRAEVADGVATVFLHRPHRNNAWTARMRADYRAVMAELEHRSDVRCVVVTGTGRHFCVGGDSDALSAHAEAGSYELDRPAGEPSPGGGDRLDDDFAWQLGYRLPIVAAVNGGCAGVGFALALFCDLRFVAADAKCTTAAPRLGLPAEYGMSWILPRLIGVARSNDLLLSGRTVTGAETADWGLWNEVCADAGATVDRAIGWATTIATTTGPEAVATTKRQIVDDLLRHHPQASIDDSIRLLDEAMGTAEYREGISAFLERRPPRFGAADVDASPDGPATGE